MPSVVLFIFALFFSNAYALVTGATSETLIRRQSAPNVPSDPQCASTCSSVSTNSCLSQSNSNPLACDCSSSFANALASCYSCAVSAGSLDAATAQQALQGITTSCSDAGMPLSNPPTLSSGNGSGSGSGPSPSSSSNSPTGSNSPNGPNVLGGSNPSSGSNSPSGSGAASGTSSGKKNGAAIVGLSYHSMTAALLGAIGLLIAA